MAWGDSDPVAGWGANDPVVATPAPPKPKKGLLEGAVDALTKYTPVGRVALGTQGAIREGGAAVDRLVSDFRSMGDQTPDTSVDPHPGVTHALNVATGTRHEVPTRGALAADRVSGTDLLDIPNSALRGFVQDATGLDPTISQGVVTAGMMALGPKGPPLETPSALPVRAPGPVRSVLEPVAARFSKTAAENQAAAALRSRATDLPATRAALERPGEIVPGSEPTTFQQTGDMGLGSLEREVATKNPDLFNQRRADQNAARRTALDSVQTGADPAEVSGLLRRQFEDMDAATQAHVDQLTAAAQDKAASLGGTTTPEASGEAVRAAISTAEQAARAREGALWTAVDPEGKLTGNVSATRSAADEIVKAEPPTAKPMSGEEGAIFDAARSLPPIAPVRDLIALRSRVSTAMREELIASGRSPTYARLSRLRGAIQDNLASSIGEAVAVDNRAVAAGQLAPQDSISGKFQTVVDGWRNQEITARANSGGANPSNPGGGATGFSGARGTEVPAGGGLGNAPGNQGVSPSPEVASARVDLGTLAGRKGSLTRAMQELGGLKTRNLQGGTLAGPDVGAILQDNRTPGLINNRSGRSAEDMAQALADKGWFGPNPTDSTASFVSALEREARGSRVYHPEDFQPEAAQVARTTEEDAHAAGVNAFDRPEVAARKLADYRSRVTELQRRAEALGIPNADKMAPDELWVDIQEREAVAAEGAGAAVADPHAAEFDRLVGRRPGEPTFDAEAAGRLSAATEATKARARTFGLQPVSSVTAKAGGADLFRLPDGQVPGKFFRSGPSGFTAMQAAVKASPDALPVLEDYAASSLRRAAMREDGTLDPAKFARWQSSHQDALRALPAETQARFADAASASQAVAEAAANRAAALKSAREGAIGRVMNAAEPQEVTRTVGNILNSRTAVTDMRALATRAKADPNAFAGLRQAVADHIANRLVGNTEVGTSGIAQIKADAYQSFMRQNRAALAEVFTPEEIGTLEAIAADIQRSKRSETAVKLPGGSNTAQDTYAVGRNAPVKGARSFLDFISGALGFAHAGPVGAAVGAMGADLMQGLRAAGIERVDQLVTQAMLDPAVAKALLAKVPEVKGNVAAKPMSVRTTILLRALQSSAYTAGTTEPRH